MGWHGAAGLGRRRVPLLGPELQREPHQAQGPVPARLPPLRRGLPEDHAGDPAPPQEPGADEVARGRGPLPPLPDRGRGRSDRPLVPGHGRHVPRDRVPVPEQHGPRRGHALRAALHVRRREKAPADVRHAPLPELGGEERGVRGRVSAMVQF